MTDATIKKNNNKTISSYALPQRNNMYNIFKEHMCTLHFFISVFTKHHVACVIIDNYVV